MNKAKETFDITTFFRINLIIGLVFIRILLFFHTKLTGVPITCFNIHVVLKKRNEVWT